MGEFVRLDVEHRQSSVDTFMSLLRARQEIAVELVAVKFACEIFGQPSVTAAELAWALSQPVSMAAVLDDIARALDLDVPDFVRRALGEEARAPIPAA